jgi:hypothetical protein
MRFESATRRRFLRLGTVASVGAVAGCSAFGGGDGEPAEDEDEAGDENGDATTDATTAPSTETAEATETTTPAVPREFVDEFEGGSFDDYRVVTGDREQWSVEPKIDGPSAYVVGTGEYENGFLAPTTDRFRWTGTGNISMDVRVEPMYNQNAAVRFGDLAGESYWHVKVAFAGEKIKLRAPGETDERIVRATPDPTETHRLDISVGEDAIAVALDGTERLRDDDPPALPAGSVGFGLQSNDTKDGATWFDNVVVRSD